MDQTCTPPPIQLVASHNWDKLGNNFIHGAQMPTREKARRLGVGTRKVKSNNGAKKKANLTRCTNNAQRKSKTVTI
jgi:hypothetical protein